MSDTGESDDGSASLNRRRGRNRKIVMRIEFDDSDDTSSTDSSNEDPIKPSCSSRQCSGGGGGRKRLITSEDDVSSSGSEIARAVVVRGRTLKKSVIVEDDGDEPSTSKQNVSATGEEGFSSDGSNDDSLEKCPICLLTLRNQEIGNPSVCEHDFCAICIEEWSKNVQTCPIDRQEFKSIIVHESHANRKFVREIKVDNKKVELEIEEPEESLTYCEVCHQSNREDIMLLCDGCNQGYHMDCLNPPLTEIPEGFWYCDNCFESEDDVMDDLDLLYEDLREMGVPETRLRIREVRQPRITRTRQSERIRASIVARTRTRGSRITSEINITKPSTSRTRQSVASTSARTTKKRKIKRRKRGQRRTYVVEYDVDNYDEKFAIKTTKKYIKKRKIRKRTGGRRRRKTTAAATSSRRRAQVANDFLAQRALRTAGAATVESRSFSLFGNPNTLEYFSDESNDELMTGGNTEGGGETSVQTSIRFQSLGSLRRRKGILRSIEEPRAMSGPVDVLSSIMDLQDRWLNVSQKNQLSTVKIGADGTLNFNEEQKQQKLQKTPTKPETSSNLMNLLKQNNKSKPAADPLNDINQAMYPRGGNHNYSGGGGGGGGGGYNNRFNNQSNYRNSSSGHSSGPYRNSGGGGGGGMGQLNPFRRDSSNNFQLNDNNNSFHNSDNFSPNNRGRFRNQRPDRRNSNRYSNDNNNQNRNQNQNTTPRAVNVGYSEPSTSSSFKSSSCNNNNNNNNNQKTQQQQQQNQQSVEGININERYTVPPPQLAVYGPVNYTPGIEEEQNPTPSLASSSSSVQSNVIPLKPPPWNDNLFKLTAYGGADDDDDDDDECPNFSLYSAESFQVARLSENSELKAADDGVDNVDKQQEDDFEEKEEDLVQLGDDDEIPDAIDNSQKDTDPDIYEPENPTEEPDNEDDDADNDEESQEAAASEKSKDDESKDEEDDEENKVEKSPAREEQEEQNSSTNADKDDDEDSEATQDKKVHEESKASRNKKGVLELYDDSDWEEWNIDKTEAIPMPPETDETSESLKKDDSSEIDTNKQSDQNKGKEKIQTESISDEEERSYTPCLDEKTEHDEGIEEKSDRAKSKSKSEEKEKFDGDRTDVSTTAVIDGMETELISDEDEDILTQEAGTSSKKKDDKGRNESSNNKKERKKETFKKISKSTKERNYRDKDRARPRRGRSRSRSNDKENQGGQRNDRRRAKRKDIERYDVRNVIGQPRTYKDRYGRDTSRPPRSRTRSRSRSRRQRSKTRSKSPASSTKRNRRSFSISPSPMSFGRPSPRRRSLSSRRSRSRRRSRSYRRSPINRRRSRSPLRIRSRSNSGVRQNGKKTRRIRRKTVSASSKSRSPSRSRGFTPKRSRSTSLNRNKNKRKRSKDRKKKRPKKRLVSSSPSPPKRPSRVEHEPARKKKRRTRTKSPIEPNWSHSPEPVAAVESSWTPPLISSNPNNLKVILNNKEQQATSKRKRDKKKKNDRRREAVTRKEKRKQRSEVRESPIAPSKEVFASGDNILVSVSFNKEGNIPPQQQTTVVTLPPTREEIVSKRRSPERPAKKQKKSKEKTQRRHKKIDTKPVAIIDLDRSPFQEITQSPKDIIVLTDSDQDGENADNPNKRKNTNEDEHLEHATSDMQLDNIDKDASNERQEDLQEESFEMQQLGPKTPPEPPIIKFSLSAKNKQIKARNPLHDEQEELQSETVEEEQQEMEMQTPNKIGPNTPPESGPCSPDAYDPFDPTKSPSASPSSSAPPDEMPSDTPEKESHTSETSAEIRENRTNSTQEKNMNPVDIVIALMNSKTPMAQDICNISTDSTYIPAISDNCETHEITEEITMPKTITVLSNVLITPGKPQQQQQQQRPTTNLPPTISSPISKTVSQPMTSQNLPKLPAAVSSSRQNGGTSNNNNDDNGQKGVESPYSPATDDYADLFDPPEENNTAPGGRSNRTTRISNNNKTEVFDNLFGSTSPPGAQSRMPNHRKRGVNNKNKKTSVKVGKGSGKLDDDQIKIFDEVPSSAVELQVKDKFLRKLNRQERVIEEVKLVLKPHYNRKHISKEDYKDILRKAVPKICHNRSGEINPKKIQKLIEAYVKKYRHRNKLGISIGTGQVSSAVKCAAYLKKL